MILGTDESKMFAIEGINESACAEAAKPATANRCIATMRKVEGVVCLTALAESPRFI